MGIIDPIDVKYVRPSVRDLLLRFHFHTLRLMLELNAIESRRKKDTPDVRQVIDEASLVSRIGIMIENCRWDELLEDEKWQSQINGVVQLASLGEVPKDLISLALSTIAVEFPDSEFLDCLLLMSP